MVLTPDVESLAAVVEEVRGWDVDPDLAPLHVGDLGWNQQFGATALAAALRVWHVDDRLAAVGLLDEPDLLRLTVAPELLREHEDVVRGLVADLAEEDGGVLPAGEVAVEARFAGPLHELLLARGLGLRRAVDAARARPVAGGAPDPPPGRGRGPRPSRRPPGGAPRGVRPQHLHGRSGGVR